MARLSKIYRVLEPNQIPLALKGMDSNPIGAKGYGFKSRQRYMPKKRLICTMLCSMDYMLIFIDVQSFKNVLA